MNFQVRLQFRQRVCHLNIQRAVKDETERGPYLCRRLVMWAVAYKFLRWVYSTRWMDERVVISKKSVGLVSAKYAGELKRDYYDSGQRPPMGKLRN